MSTSAPFCSLAGSILIETSKGNLTFGLYGLDCPQNTLNLLQLCAMGFYDGCFIPRVVRNAFFEIRGHAPHFSNSNNTPSLLQEQNALQLVAKVNNATTEDPNEIKEVPLEIAHQLQGALIDGKSPANSKRTGRPVTVSKPGLLVMIASPSSSSTSSSCSRSSFLITTSERRLDYLDRKQTILGEVIPNKDTQNILRSINALALKNGESVDGVPLRRIHIKQIRILDDACSIAVFNLDRYLLNDVRRRFFDKVISETGSSCCPIIRTSETSVIHNYDLINTGSQQQGDHFLSSGDDDDNSNSNTNNNDIFNLKSLERELKEVETKIKKRRDDETQKIIMQLIGERPSGAEDVDPPENVLFVCKLNPLTQDADLAQCFESFGKIASCEIVKDKKTGRSLQYAFIEFETKEACAAAFRKMDRVSIDNSRIHVDFSQSVSKVYWQNKQQSGQRRPRDQAQPQYEGVPSLFQGF